MKKWQIGLSFIVMFGAGMLIQKGNDIQNTAETIQSIADSCQLVHAFIIGNRTFECRLDKDI